MNRFVGTVARDIARHGLLAEGQTALVAVSGGADSVVLLDVLHRLSKRHRWSLVVAHFNHQLRGRQSDGDERWVRALAARLGWPVVSGRAPVAERARAGGVSTEMAGRAARQEFLASAGRACGAAAVALAHHADDQAELFLLRLLRGAGSEGFGGMKWAGASPADSAVRLVRPLLGRSREEIRAYARAWSLRFRHDATNDAIDLLRNRVRHKLIPLLEREYQPGLRDVLVRAAELLGADGEFVALSARAWRNRPRSSYADLPVALQRQVLVSQLIEQGVRPEFETVEALRAAPGRRIQGGGGRVWQRSERGRIAEAAPPARPEPADAALARGGRGVLATSAVGAGGVEVAVDKVAVDLRSGRGEVRVGGYRVWWRIREGRAPRFKARVAGREWFDADEVGPEIELRPWRVGDCFQPLGFPRGARLQDLFAKAGIPREGRAGRWLATAGGSIWWVDGLCPAEACKVSPQSRRFLQWNWEMK